MSAPAARTVGRNDPCPCGSGRKFKQCCIDKVRNQAQQRAQAVASLSPQDKIAMMHTHAGEQQLKVGQYVQAIESCRQALAANPNFALAYYVRGMAHQGIEQPAAMVADFQKAVELDSNNGRMLHKIGLLYTHLGKYVEAMPLLQRIIEIMPDFEEAWVLLAECYYRVGKVDTSRQMFQQLAQKFPNNPVIKVLLATFLPQIPSSNEEIEQVRTAFMANLDRLMAENFRLTNPESQVRIFPFYQAYHARDNRAINRKLAEFFLSVSPHLNFTAPHCKQPRKKKAKLRIGFVSEFMHKITLNQFFLSIMEGMNSDPELEIFIFSNSPLSNPTVQEVSGKIHKYVPLFGDFNTIRDTIAREEIDVLIYLEIGMTHQSYFLALARLAHIQCVCGGHPTTTGIPNMDYFISTTGAHGPDPAAEYTEKPMLFERIIAVFERPETSPAIKSRAELGLPDGDINLYACPVMLFKLHPDMDKIFAGILQKDPKARILLFDPMYTLWRSQLEKRFAATMPQELAERILFLPFARKDIFLDILRTVDAVLDCVHFSFGTTAYLVLGANVPFITWPGEFMRGRTGDLMYKYMDMPELVASDHENYIELAVKLATDKKFYTDMVEKIRARSDQLFNDTEATSELSARLKQLYAEGAA